MMQVVDFMKRPAKCTEFRWTFLSRWTPIPNPFTADDASGGRDEEPGQVLAPGRAPAGGPPPRRYCPSTCN